MSSSLKKRNLVAVGPPRRSSPPLMMRLLLMRTDDFFGGESKPSAAIEIYSKIMEKSGAPVPSMHRSPDRKTLKALDLGEPLSRKALKKKVLFLYREIQRIEPQLAPRFDLSKLAARRKLRRYGSKNPTIGFLSTAYTYWRIRLQADQELDDNKRLYSYRLLRKRIAAERRWIREASALLVIAKQDGASAAEAVPILIEAMSSAANRFMRLSREDIEFVTASLSQVGLNQSEGIEEDFLESLLNIDFLFALMAAAEQDCGLLAEPLADNEFSFVDRFFKLLRQRSDATSWKVLSANVPVDSACENPSGHTAEESQNSALKRWRKGANRPERLRLKRFLQNTLDSKEPILAWEYLYLASFAADQIFKKKWAYEGPHEDDRQYVESFNVRRGKLRHHYPAYRAELGSPTPINNRVPKDTR